MSMINNIQPCQMEIQIKVLGSGWEWATKCHITGAQGITEPVFYVWHRLPQGIKLMYKYLVFDVLKTVHRKFFFLKIVKGK